MCVSRHFHTYTSPMEGLFGFNPTIPWNFQFSFIPSFKYFGFLDPLEFLMTFLGMGMWTFLFSTLTHNTGQDIIDLSVHYFCCLFLTEVFDHIRCTHLSDNGVPHVDMRALANEELRWQENSWPVPLFSTQLFVYECVWVHCWWCVKCPKW